MFDQQTHIVLNPVSVDRAADFERFLVEVVEPAVQAQRPDLLGRVRYLKATRPEDADAGVVTYAFVFEGGDLEADWDLSRVLTAHYGDEEGARLLDEWEGTFVPLRRWLSAFGEPPEDARQLAWSLAPVTLEGATPAESVSPQDG